MSGSFAAVAKESPRAKTLKAFQLLVRYEGSDDHGYCQCYTCDAIARFTEMHGGHFIDKSVSSKWAFDKRTVKPQCPICNCSHDPEVKERFETNLREEYGDEFVDHVIATRHQITKFYHSDYRDMLAYFNEQIRDQKKRIVK